MINNEPVTISSTFRNSAGASIRHNKREFIAENVDPERTKDNIYLKPYEELPDVYHNLFDDALEKYNEKQRNLHKPSRQIPDYLEKIEKESSKKNGRKPFYEVVFQIGKAENFGVADWSQNAELAKQILTEFYNSFAERNPNLYVFGAVIHMDETTPHMHIDFVPVVYGCRQSLETQTSLSKALMQQGIPKAESRTFTERSGWFQTERAALEQIANAHGIEIDHLESEPRATLAVEDYKRKRMQADRAAAEKERDQALQEYSQIRDASTEQEKYLNNLQADIADTRTELDTLQNSAQQAEEKAAAAEARAEERAAEAEEALENINRKVLKAEQDTKALEENLQNLLDSSARAAAEAVYDALENRTAGRIKTGIQEKFHSFIDWLTGNGSEPAEAEDVVLKTLGKIHPTLPMHSKLIRDFLSWFAERVEKRLLNGINRLFADQTYRASPAVREKEIQQAVTAAKKQIRLEYQKIGERTFPVRAAAPVRQQPAPKKETQEVPRQEEESRSRQQETEKKKKKNRGMDR